MPKESLSVYLTAIDGMSPVFASITDKTKALDKESQELQQTYEALQKANKGLIERKTELQKQLKLVNEEVKEARKSFNALNDEASSDALNKAVEKQQKLRDEIAGTTKALQENQKTYKENIETVRKGSLGDGGGNGFSALAPVSTGGASSGVSDTGSLKAGGVSTSGLGAMDILAGLGIGDKLSGLAQDLGGAMLTSALGSEMGGLATSALSGALSGAAMGTALGGPGIGTAIGALAGAISSAASGASQVFQARDDAFKDYYGGLYDDVKGRSGEMVESGSTIAGGREQTRMAFSRRLGGDDQAAAYLAEVEKMAASTNYEYDEIVGYAKLLLNSYDPDEVFGVLRDLSDATAGLDLSSSDVNMMISGLSRMRTTGKATQEYLNYFRERGVDVDQALADSLNVNKSSISEMVTKGRISGDDAAQAILDFIQQEFGGLSDGLASTYDAMVDNLGDVTSSIQAAGGDAYNSLRKSGVSAQQEAYEGELGEALKEINAVMGENQARKENLQDQYMREVLDAVLTGTQGALWSTFDETQQKTLTEMSEQYATLMEQYKSGDTDTGAELEKLYEEAQTLGQEYFDNSDEVARLNQIELDEIEAIRLNTVGLENAYTALYNLNQTMSRGLIVRGVGISTAPAVSQIEDAENTLAAWRADPDSVSSEQIRAAQETQADAMAAARRNAFGLGRVPYNDYPALLHEGERVLTAAEARAQDAGSGQPMAITITGNSFTGTPEEMAYDLARIILQRLTEAGIAAAPK